MLATPDGTTCKVKFSLPSPLVADVASGRGDLKKLVKEGFCSMQCILQSDATHVALDGDPSFTHLLHYGGTFSLVFSYLGYTNTEQMVPLSLFEYLAYFASI